VPRATVTVGFINAICWRLDDLAAFVYPSTTALGGVGHRRRRGVKEVVVE
jgi:hypothetical protein